MIVCLPARRKLRRRSGPAQGIWPAQARWFRDPGNLLLVSDHPSWSCSCWTDSTSFAIILMASETLQKLTDPRCRKDDALNSC